MRPSIHKRISYLSAISMGINENESEKIAQGSIKPDWFDFPFQFPRHFYCFSDESFSDENETCSIIKSENDCKKDKIGQTMHYYEDNGNPFHSSILYIVNHIRYEYMVERHWNDWNLDQIVLNAEPIIGELCDLTNEAHSYLHELNDAILDDDKIKIQEITTYMIGRTSSYIKGLIQ